MNTLNAFYFLLLIIVIPCTHSQSDIIALIQKTDEGKEVLEAVYLDVSINNFNLNASAISSRLSLLSSTFRKAKTELKVTYKKISEECQKDINLISSRFHDFTLRVTTANRMLKNTEKINKRRTIILSRAREELGTYRRFEAFNKGNRRNWKAFWQKAVKSSRAAIDLISRLRTHISELHRKHRQATLIELPNNYSSSLLEISKEFENISQDLGEFKPVISNLIDLAKNTKHLKTKTSRRLIRHLIGLLSETLHNDVNTFNEENEHQESIFDGLESLFEDSVARSKRVVAGIQKLHKATLIKLAWLKTSFRGNTHLANLSKEIVDSKSLECKTTKQFMLETKNKYNRIINITGQLQEVLTDRFSSIKNFLEEESSVKGN